MAKLPDGQIFIFKTSRKEVKAISKELILCKNCNAYDKKFYRCDYWEQYTDKDGYCYLAEKKVEDENSTQTVDG